MQTRSPAPSAPPILLPKFLFYSDSDPEVIDAIFQAGASLIPVSWHSPAVEVADALFGNPRMDDATIESIFKKTPEGVGKRLRQHLYDLYGLEIFGCLQVEAARHLLEIADSLLFYGVDDPVEALPFFEAFGPNFCLFISPRAGRAGFSTLDRWCNESSNAGYFYSIQGFSSPAGLVQMLSCLPRQQHFEVTDEGELVTDIAAAEGEGGTT